MGMLFKLVYDMFVYHLYVSETFLYTCEFFVIIDLRPQPHGFEKLETLLQLAACVKITFWRHMLEFALLPPCCNKEALQTGAPT